MSDAELRNQLVSAIVEYVSRKIPAFTLDDHSDTSFSRLGLDSLGHVELSTIIENTTGLQVEPDLAFNYPTVNALVTHVVDTLLPRSRETAEVADSDA